MMTFHNWSTEKVSLILDNINLTTVFKKQINLKKIT